MAKRVRGFETVGDMLRSLAVVGAFIAVVLVLTLRQTPEQLRPVDPIAASEVYGAVAQAAPFAAQLPGPTPAGWTATSARVTLPTDRPYSWYVGYSTDTEAFVAVTQIFGDADETEEALEAVGATGEAVGTVRIDGETWTELERSDGSRRALVRTTGEPADDAAERVTTVVLGTAPFTVLEPVADALRPAAAAAADPAGGTVAPKPSPTKTIRKGP